MKKVLTIALFLLAGLAIAQDPTTDKAVKALQGGDAKGLAALFADNVDLKMTDIDDIFSKDQAEQIIKKFFEKNPAKSFKLVNSGETTLGLIYRIGELETGGGKYKVDMKLKKIGDGYVISILEMEKM